MKRVLVFESDAEFARSLKEAFSARECDVEIVEDGEGGISRAETEPPDLILLAIELPKMNGFSVCNKLKRHKKLAEVPLVLMSAEATDETFDQHKRLRTRADDYVHKPITAEALIERIRPLVDLPALPAFVSDPDVEVEADTAFEQLLAPRASAPPPLSRHPRTPSGAPPALDVEPEELDAEDIELNAPSELVAIDPDSFPSELPPRAAAADLAQVRELEERVRSLESELADAQEEVRAGANQRSELLERKEHTINALTGEVDELKGRIAKSEKTGTARDFLDLREQLNRKDKEILEVRDGLSQRDREIIKSRELVISLERDKADNQDLLRALQDDKAGLEKVRDALWSEKAAANKLADEFKAKSEGLTEELDARAIELKRTREHFENELLARDAATQALRDDHKRELIDASHQATAVRERAVAEATLRTQTDANAELEAALASARIEATRVRDEAVKSREGELKSEHDSRLASLHRAHEDSSRKLKAEHAQLAQEAKLLAQTNLANREEELAADKANALSEAAALAQAAYDGLALDKQQAEAARDARIAALSGDLDSRTEQLELTRRAVDELNGRVSQLEAALASSRLESQELAQRLAQESHRLAHARQKWQDDQSALHEARRSLTQALELIGTTETRHLLD